MSTATELPKGMLAGQVARELGIGVQTLHYYEREGLIPPPSRTASRYRIYDASLVDRVRFVRKAQSLGLTLDEIKEIVGLAERGTCPCGHVHNALAERLKDVDERLKELRSFRAELAALVNRAARVSSDAQRSGGGRNAAKLCAIVEEAAPPARIARVQSTAPLKRRSAR
ncbi:MAG: heavy metal-responsive transcriptional regulator [Gemmatimonadaceae bacterium]